MTEHTTALRGATEGGLHARVLDALGQDVVDGRLAAGSVVDPVAIGVRFGVSRSVVREALRVLQSLGMVAPRQRVGTQVLPRSAWDLMAPTVIRWRGASPDYFVQQRELLELRLGLEPVAAALTAGRAGPEAVHAAATAMRAAVDARDGDAYLEADVRFHTAILSGSGNAVFGHFATTVEALLRTRTSERRGTITEYTPDAADRHVLVGEAVLAGDADAAERLAAALIRTTLAEFAEEARRS